MLRAELVLISQLKVGKKKGFSNFLLAPN